ncbi:MAG: PKD domain-containing protein [Flavobacteriales bacterium]|nr:PKD domain-containing protein [Flavobacteriales bacterium]
MGKKEQFESALKEVLGDYQVPYDESLWESIEQNLDSPKSKGKSNSKSYGLMAAAAVAIFVGSVVYLNTQEATLDNTDKSNIKTEKLSETKTEDNSHAGIVIDTASNETKVENEVEAPTKQELSDDKVDNSNEGDISQIEKIELTENSLNTTEPETITPYEPVLLPDPEDSNTGTNENTAPKDLAAFSSSTKNVCANQSVQFYPENVAEGVSYMWYFGDGHSSEEVMPVHKYQSGGQYNVSLEVHNIQTSELLDSKKVLSAIQVQDAPDASFTWNKNSYLAADPALIFRANIGDAQSIQWNFDDGSFDTGQEVRHIYRKKGSYTVSMEVTSNSNCKSKSVEVVSIDKDWNLLAPNGFTPDGNNINDLWFPQALIEGPYSQYPFQLRVVHRNTGKTVFTSNTSNKQWDGRFEGQSQKAKTGDAFAWFVIVKTEFGEEEYTGAITVVDAD